MVQKMSDKTSSKRRRTALLLLLITSAGIATLLYFEQVAVIYVLATLALVILLLIVAFADLERVGRGDESADSKTSSPNDAKQNQPVTLSPADQKIPENRG